jgi:hypothetical protein
MCPACELRDDEAARTAYDEFLKYEGDEYFVEELVAEGIDRTEAIASVQEPRFLGMVIEFGTPEMILADKYARETFKQALIKRDQMVIKALLELRDRDRIFGQEFVKQVKAMGIKQVLSAPRSPWQRAYVERLIGTIRRECLDHMVVFNERSLYRHLQAFVEYYHRSRIHLALEKDTPAPRPIQTPASGRIISIAVLGGLHHRYERRAA